ncbi:MAG: hypothetical protein JO023_22540, partial [Chloroflexi bacterium]|nr:hypothetical protein [Chloroflexota bacterium]
AEYHVGFGDVPDAGASRAELVAVVAPDKSPFALDQAQRLARKLLPSDAAAQGKVEGNASFAVEHFTSASLGSALPPDWFASSSPGDLLAVYVRRPDGRVTTVVVGPGDDPTPLLARASPPG